MATTVQVELQAKTDKAIKEIEGLQKEIKNLSKQVEDSNKKTAETLKDVEKSSSGVAKGVSKIGDSLKTGIVFLYVEAFSKLTEVFNENQKVADFFATTFEVLSRLFNDVIGTVISAVSSFDNFKDAVSGVFDNIKTLLNPAFIRLQKLIKGVQLGFKELFQKKDVEGIKRLKDELAALDEEFVVAEQEQTKLLKTTRDYFTEIVNTSQAVVELNKASEIARVRQQGLIETFDLQAEKLRQVRDEERNTIDERIQANNELAKVLDEQEKQMLEMVDLQIQAAQLEFEKNQNQENTIALLEAQQEKEAVLAQIQGFRSEQLSNDLALNREKLELEQSITDAESERAIAEAEFTAEQIEGEMLRLEALRDAAIREEEIETERLTKKRDLYNEGTQAFVDAQNELLAFQQENSQKQLEIERDLAKAKEETITEALGNLATIVGENTKFGKAIAVVQAIRDTLSGANKALSASPPPFNFIAAAAVAASGFANVKSILSTPDPTPPSFATGGTGGAARVASVPQVAQAPAFNIVGASGINQLAEVVGQQATQPVKAFVVSKDVTTSQELDRNIVKGASL